MNIFYVYEYIVKKKKKKIDVIEQTEWTKKNDTCFSSEVAPNFSRPCGRTKTKRRSSHHPHKSTPITVFWSQERMPVAISRPAASSVPGSELKNPLGEVVVDAKIIR